MTAWSRCSATTLDRELAQVYFQILWNVLRAPMQDALRRLVVEQRATNENLTDRFPFMKELAATVYKDALQEGQLEALRDSILRAAKHRGVVLSEQQQQCIQTCADRQTIDRWFDNVLDAAVADDIFR